MYLAYNYLRLTFMVQDEKYLLRNELGSRNHGTKWHIYFILSWMNQSINVSLNTNLNQQKRCVMMLPNGSRQQFFMHVEMAKGNQHNKSNALVKGKKERTSRRVPQRDMTPHHSHPK
jgi:hypothetical protein